ncbi:MAG: hypothetical protein ABEJ95_07840, partial [Candidatus Nanohalobium sp.]
RDYHDFDKLFSHFRDFFREAVSDSWRAPSNEQKETAKTELQRMIEEAYPIFLSWTENRTKPGDAVMQYIEENEKCFQNIEIKNRKELDSGKVKLWASAPPKLGKFMLNPDFTVKVNQKQR